MHEYDSIQFWLGGFTSPGENILSMIFFLVNFNYHDFENKQMIWIIRSVK